MNNNKTTAKVLAGCGLAVALSFTLAQIGQSFPEQLPKLKLLAYGAMENLAVYSAGLSLPSKTDTGYIKDQQVLSNGVLLPDIIESNNSDSVPETTADITEPPPETTAPVTDTSTPTVQNPLIIAQNINTGVKEDLTIYTKNSGAITEKKYEPNAGENIINLEGGGQVRNCTEIPKDTLISESKKAPEFNIELNSEPQVLIMHTHTTEAYEVKEKDYYDDSYYCRTLDPTQSVVAVGQKIAEKIAEKGICVVHDGTIHDDPSYSNSYSRSAVTVQKILDKYPSIKVVLDIHRDGIADSDGTRIAPVATINGKKAAQIMIISGCDDGTMDMPNYLQNYRLACGLQSSMESRYQGLTRSVLFDYRFYNQNLTTGSLLIEVGANGNTLSEALYSGELVGDSVGEALLKYVE